MDKSRRLAKREALQAIQQVPWVQERKERKEKSRTLEGRTNSCKSTNNYLPGAGREGKFPSS